MRGKDRWASPCTCSTQDHPRLCGEKLSGTWSTTSAAGSPPPMRGKVFGFKVTTAIIRITPAYAGKSLMEWVYTICKQGSPPPMRGKDLFHDKFLHVFRITPAYAGKRSRRCFPCPKYRDHPRLCGEKQYHTLCTHNYQGSPPPMRGKGVWELSLAQVYRITPAYAGKSSSFHTRTI